MAGPPSNLTYNPQAETAPQYFTRTQSAINANNPTEAPLNTDITKTPTYGSVSPQQNKQPATEPAVVSSAGIPGVIAQNKQKLADLSQKGMTMDENGNLSYADGSMVPQPDPNTDPNTMDPYTKAITDKITSLQQSSDAATTMQLSAIHQQYDQLRAQQRELNAGENAVRQNALLTAGTSRYAPMDEAGTMHAQISFGLDTIAKYDAAENAAIATATAAGQANNEKLADQAIGQLQAARDAKQKAAATVLKQLQDMSQKRQDQRQQAARDSAVADLVTQGITDPAKMLTTLNYDQNGKQTGDFTADEISKTLKSIADNTGAAGIKGLTGDVGNFYTLKNTPGALPASILALPQEKQLAAYISMVNQAKKGVVSPATGAASAGGAITPSPAGTVPVVGFDASNGPNQHDQAAFLGALPGGEHGSTAKLIAGLADYSINPSSFPTRLLKGQSGLTRADAIALTKQYDPSYDENNFTAAAALQKSITSGNYSQAIASANTLIAHLDKMWTDAQHMPAFTQARVLPGVGSIATVLGSAFHNTAINNFKIDTSAVGTEAAKIYKSTGAPATTEIEDWQHNINANMTPNEVKGAMTTIVELMAGKLSSISNNYQNTLGKPYTKALLTPQSVKILKQLGIDPQTVDPLYSASPSAQLGSSDSLSSFLSSAPANSGGAAVNWDGAKI